MGTAETCTFKGFKKLSPTTGILILGAAGLSMNEYTNETPLPSKPFFLSILEMLLGKNFVPSVMLSFEEI
ncbi:MAG: hypothetical protein ACLFP8_07990, partial [Alphaproteobacteria bacterium]